MRMSPPSTKARGHRFTMLMTDEERAKLAAIAEAERRTASDWLRLVIEDAYAERFGTQKAKRPKR